MIIITGSTGLIGSSASDYFLKKGEKVIGIDNDLRSYFFGKIASNKWKEKKLKENKLYVHINARSAVRLEQHDNSYGCAWITLLSYVRS